MATLFGRNYTRDELLSRMGDISQVGGVRLGALEDGFERGTRTAEVRTGSGLEFTVLGDRGMDVAWASFRGIPISWRSATTAKAPGFYEPEGLGWLRGFHGGLVAGCGLTYAGAPCLDQGQPLGLHGRLSSTPATHFTYGGDWTGDDYDMWVSGRMREATVFGENLVLERRILARLGESRLVIQDTVTNEGHEPAAHMQVYHINFGHPVLSEDTVLLGTSADTKPRDQVAAPGMDRCRSFEAPTPGYSEQVFYHTPRGDAQGMAQYALVNRAFGGGQGLGAYVRFDAKQLPRLVQWKMMGRGTYVCGLEPATNWVDGRAKERAEGRLRMLQPGEVCRYVVEIGVLSSQKEIDDFATP